jgi:hypothetical protein
MMNDNELHGHKKQKKKKETKEHENNSCRQRDEHGMKTYNWSVG